MRMAQIELALDPAPRLVLQFAGTVELIDRLPLGGDQQKLELVNQLDTFLLPAVAIAIVDMSQPVAVTAAQRRYNFLRQPTLRRKLIEPFERGFDRLMPRLNFLGLVGMALAAPDMGKSEHADHQGQQQALPDKRHEYDGKCEEEDQITIWKRLALSRHERDRQRRSERDANLTILIDREIARKSSRGRTRAARARAG